MSGTAQFGAEQVESRRLVMGQTRFALSRMQRRAGLEPLQTFLQV